MGLLQEDETVFSYGTLVIEGKLKPTLVKTALEQIKDIVDSDYFWQNPFIYDIQERTLGEMQEMGLLDKLRSGQTSDTPCLYVMLNEYPFESIPLIINNIRIFCNNPIDTLHYRLYKSEEKK